VQITIYLGTEVSVRSREKEALQVAFANKKLNQLNFWHTKRDEVIDKIENVTDTVDPEDVEEDPKDGVFAKEVMSPTFTFERNPSEDVSRAAYA
jgi:hypothetical protein